MLVNYSFKFSAQQTKNMKLYRLLFLAHWTHLFLQKIFLRRRQPSCILIYGAIFVAPL